MIRIDKFGKKAVVWKYILGIIMALIVIFIVYIMISQSKEKSVEIISSIKPRI